MLEPLEIFNQSQLYQRQKLLRQPQGKRQLEGRQQRQLLRQNSAMRVRQILHRLPMPLFECNSLKTHCKDHEREIWPFTNVAAVTRRLIVYRHLATGRFALKMPGESSYSVSLPVFNSKLNIDYYLDNFNKSQICLDLIRLEFNDS